MAIEVDEVLETVHALESEINEMVDLLRIYKANKVDVKGVGEIIFTDTQKQSIESEYLNSKSRLVDSFKQLP